MRPENNFMFSCCNIILKSIKDRHFVHCFLFYKTYNIIATTPQVEEGGEQLGFTSIIFYLRYGKCSCLLHMQMAGRRRIIGSQPGE